MRKHILTMLAVAVAIVCNAADIKTLQVTTDPQMHCSNCENKIKKNLRFEKGVKEIRTDLENQIVTVVYDADKTDEGKIIEAFGKIKYDATVVGDEADPEVTVCAEEESSCCKK